MLNYFGFLGDNFYKSVEIVLRFSLIFVLNALRVRIEVKTEAREEKIEKIDESHYLVWVKAPRIKGKANEAILKLLKHFFKRQVRLVSGATSTTKIVDVYDE